jgi:hypothetical protein
MDPFEELAAQLKCDPDKRAKFFADLRELLSRYGVDPGHEQVVKALGSDTPVALEQRCMMVSPQILVCDDDDPA